MIDKFYFLTAVRACVRMQDPPDWTDILTHFRGSELQNYFTKILEDDLKAIIKPQYVDQIPKAVRGSVQQLLDKKDEMLNQVEICKALGETGEGSGERGGPVWGRRLERL